MKLSSLLLAALSLMTASGPALAKEAKQGTPPAAAAPAANTERYENLGLFQKVLFFVEQNYVEDVKNKDLIYGAIKGMMETLDPHSNFLPPEVFKDMKTETSGRFGGIGIEIGLKGTVLTVISPIEDTPAYRAGLKAGDRILKINGESTKGMSLSEAVTKMRGKRGSDVSLQIWREGLKAPRDYKMARDEIKMQTAKSETLEPGFLYMKLTNFNERSFDDLKSIIDKFERKNGPVRGLVFDLRNNPGGLLDQAVDVTSLFVEDVPVVSTMGRADEKKVMMAKRGIAHKDFPMAVLVNGASASASEIVAGALQDHKRAVIMGQPTFGKGSVQTVIELAPDVGLKLTIARYYTPNGRSIQLKGIQPDLLLDDVDQKALDAATKKNAFIREKDLRHAMNNEDDDTGEKDVKVEELIAEEKDAKEEAKKAEKLAKDDENRPVDPKEDYQVRQALNYIKSYQIFKAAGGFEPFHAQSGAKKAQAK